MARMIGKSSFAPTCRYGCCRSRCDRGSAKAKERDAARRDAANDVTASRCISEEMQYPHMGA